MLGRTHGASGVLAGVATSALAGSDPVAQVGWVAVVAGAALLPDLDMPQSTVGRMWGPLTAGVRLRYAGRSMLLAPGMSHVVSAVAGGHRKGTHCWIGIAATFVVLLITGRVAVASAVVLALAAGLVILAADFWVPGRMHWASNLAVCVGVGVAAYQNGWTLPGWLPPAMALGMVVHCAGDDVTKQGVRWLWPLGSPTSRRDRDASWWRIKTGGTAEYVILHVIGGLIAATLAIRASV